MGEATGSVWRRCFIKLPQRTQRDTRFSFVAYRTFKQWSDVPDVDAAGLHELSESDLQEEDRDSSDKDDQQVGDQEDTCRRRRVKGSVHIFLQTANKLLSLLSIK